MWFSGAKTKRDSLVSERLPEKHVSDSTEREETNCCKAETNPGCAEEEEGNSTKEETVEE
jgi:hypothetical protein